MSYSSSIQELSRYGAPLLNRRKVISDLLATSNNTQPLEFCGKLHQLKVIEVRIELPIYRLANGRTRTYQLEYLATHPESTQDLFTRDPDSTEAQIAQHEVLKQLISEEELLATFRDPSKHQVEPLICTQDGTIVNGNRRLCAWRELYYRDANKYKHFQYISVMVLPPCDEEAIEDLEKRLQIRKQLRAEYKWHSRAMMARNDIDRGKTLSDTAKSYGISKQELELHLSCLDYAAAYLESIGKKDQWSMVDDSKHAFEQYAKWSKKITDSGHLELFETLTFALIREGSSDGRLYDVIPDVGQNIAKISQVLSERLDISSSCDDEDESDLLAGDLIVDTDNASAVAVAIKANPDKRAIIKETQRIIDDVRHLEEERRDRAYLGNQLRKVASMLNNLVASGIDLSQADLNGVYGQIQNIEDSLVAIKEWLGML